MTAQSAHYGVQQSEQISEAALRVTGLANIPIHQISTVDFVVQALSFYSLNQYNFIIKRRKKLVKQKH